MSARTWLANECKAMGAATLHFGVWVGALVLLKYLILAEYSIAFTGAARAIVAVLLLAKVVLVLEHVPLGGWELRRPAWISVLVRTAVYIAGVVLVLFIERVVERLSDHESLSAAVRAAMQSDGAHHFWLNLYAVGGALLSFNLSAVVRRHLGRGALVRMLLSPLPSEQQPDHTS